MSIVKSEVMAIEPTRENIDRWLEARAKIQFAKDWIKEMEAVLDEWGCNVITETGQDITVDTVRFYVGVKKSWKCADKKRAIEAVLTLAKDENHVGELLSSDPVKRGAVTKLAEEQGVNIDGIWTCDESDELREGKPKLQKIDTKFIR